MSSNRDTVIRSLHDVGGAAWFGGSLMGAVALNGASKDVSNPLERAKIASSGWARWAPFSAAAIGVHLVGGAGLMLAHSDRIQNQAGVGSNTAVKLVLTGAALVTTAASGVLGAKLAKTAGDDTYTEGGTTPSDATPDNVAAIQQQLRILQWATPALTGAIIVLGAQQGEQQRPQERIRGWLKNAS